MQSRAEKYLVHSLVQMLQNQPTRQALCRILNIGAGQSLSIERQLSEAGCQYVCDRIDVDACNANYPAVENCWVCSVESMMPVKSSAYEAAFANYVFEHISNLDLAAKEIHRVLAPDAIFVAAIPNPTAIEFRVAKHTPLWLHKKIRQSDAWETKYAYKSINELTSVFEINGFLTTDIQYYPAIGGYLHRFPVLSTLGKIYDQLIERLHQTSLLGDVCIVFQRKNDELAS